MRVNIVLMVVVLLSLSALATAQLDPFDPFGLGSGSHLAESGTTTTTWTEKGINYKKVSHKTQIMAEGSVSVGERSFSGLGQEEESSSTTYRIEQDKEIEVGSENRVSFVLKAPDGTKLAERATYTIVDQAAQTKTEANMNSVLEQGKVVVGDRETSGLGMRIAGTETVRELVKEPLEGQEARKLKIVSVNRFELGAFGNTLGSCKRDIETFPAENKTVSYDLQSLAGRTVGTITTTLVVDGKEKTQTQKVDTTEGKQD